MPDARAEAIYRAELLALWFGGWFLDLADAEAHVAHICRTKFWRQRTPVRKVVMRYGETRNSQSSIRDGIGYVDINRARLCEQFVHHEMAHLIAPAAGHGPQFLEALLALTKFTMGQWFEQRLRHQLEAEGIKT